MCRRTREYETLRILRIEFDVFEDAVLAKLPGTAGAKAWWVSEFRTCKLTATQRAMPIA